MGVEPVDYTRCSAMSFKQGVGLRNLALRCDLLQLRLAATNCQVVVNCYIVNGRWQLRLCTVGSATRAMTTVPIVVLVQVQFGGFCVTEIDSG